MVEKGEGEMLLVTASYASSPSSSSEWQCSRTPSCWGSVGLVGLLCCMCTGGRFGCLPRSCKWFSPQPSVEGGSLSDIVFVQVFSGEAPVHPLAFALKKKTDYDYGVHLQFKKKEKIKINPGIRLPAWVPLLHVTPLSLNLFPVISSTVLSIKPKAKINK